MKLVPSSPMSHSQFTELNPELLTGDEPCEVRDHVVAFSRPDASILAGEPSRGRRNAMTALPVAFLLSAPFWVAAIWWMVKR